MVTQPDASGGLGSFSSQLLGTITQGLSLVAAGELSKRYGFGFGADGTVAVDADGVVRDRSAPARDVSIALSNPIVIVGGLAVVGLIVALVRR